MVRLVVRLLCGLFGRLVVLVWLVVVRLLRRFFARLVNLVLTLVFTIVILALLIRYIPCISCRKPWCDS